MNSDSLKKSSPDRRKSQGVSSFASNKSGSSETTPTWRTVSSFSSTTGINARFPAPPPGKRLSTNQLNNPIMNRPLKPATKSSTRPKFRSSVSQQSDDGSWLTDQSFSSIDSSPERSVSSIRSTKSSPERKHTQSFTVQTSFSSQSNENDVSIAASSSTYTDNHNSKSNNQMFETYGASPSSSFNGANTATNSVTTPKSSKKRDPAYNNPDNWTSSLHTEYNREFYYNEKLQITQWEKPKCLLTEEDKHSKKNWEVHGDGKDIWYVNTKTLKSQYEKPQCFVIEESYAYYLKIYSLSIGFCLFVSAIFPSTTHFLLVYTLWFIKLFFKQLGVLLL